MGFIDELKSSQNELKKQDAIRKEKDSVLIPDKDVLYIVNGMKKYAENTIRNNVKEKKGFTTFYRDTGLCYFYYVDMSVKLWQLPEEEINKSADRNRPDIPYNRWISVWRGDMGDLLYYYNINHVKQIYTKLKSLLESDELTVDYSINDNYVKYYVFLPCDENGYV